MPDTNEERLLNELLRDIVTADAQLAASGDLERRTMREWDSRDAPSSLPGQSTRADRRWTIVPVIAAVLVLAVAAAMRLGTTAKAPLLDRAERQPPITMRQPEDPVEEAPKPSREPSVKSPMPRRRQAPPQNEIISFVPLVPMTAGELSGSFSIARVQIGQTQADVLLGEDGMARAIRVSTDRNASWRSR